MKKKTNSRKATSKPVTRVTNEAQATQRQQQRFENGLTEALGFGIPSFAGRTQVSQVDTMFKNLRYYLLSNFRNILSYMYVEFGIVRTIIDMPVDDALRGGIDITTDELDEDQLLDLHTTIERENDMQTLGQAMKYNRLFGGAGIIILTEQDPATELNLEAITEEKRLDFHAVDMWELYSGYNIKETDIIKPVTQDLQQFNFYGEKLDRSRVMQLKGAAAPSFVRHQLRGWGLSALEPIVRPLNQFLKSVDLTFEVLDEFKLDIFKIKGLSSTLERADGSDIIRKRVALANVEKSYQNAMTMDSEDDYQQKQISFTGIAEAMEGIRTQLASETNFPQAKLFGEASVGFSSGQDSIENYNAMVESQIRQKAKYDILRMVELRCQQKFGFIPDDLAITFKPLRMVGAEAEQNVKNAQFTRTLQAKQANEMTSEEFREAINKDKLLPTQLDLDQGTLNLLEDLKQTSPGGEAPITDATETKLKAPEAKA